MRRASGEPRGTDSMMVMMMDDKLEDLKKRFHLLSGDRQAYYATTQWTLQALKERATVLRAENRELYDQLNHLQRVVKAHLEGNNEGEKMAYQLRELRKKHDEVKRKADEKHAQLASLKDTMRALVMETPSEGEVGQQGAVNQLTSVVRGLEHKIEKASLKHTEALTVKGTYEQILVHLQDDRIGYDSHVNSLEQGVQLKDKELTELTTLYQDAIRSKELAKDELTKCEALANDDKKHRDQVLEEKRQRIKQLMETNARTERKVKREEQRIMEVRQRAKPLTPTPERDPEFIHQRLNSLYNAYQCVSSLAGVGNYFNDISTLNEIDTPSLYKDTILHNSIPDFNIIAQYIASQGTMARTLESHQSKATAKLDALRAERDSLAETVSNLRLRQLVPTTGTRKQVDSYEGRLAQANAAYVRARAKFERAAKANSAILAGVSSLASRLQFVEPNEEFPTVTDQSLYDVIQLSKKKIDYIVSAGYSSTLAPTTPSALPLPLPLPPQFIVRVKQTLQPPVAPELQPDESQVPTRATVKSASAALVQRELKRAKRKQRKQHSASSSSSPSPSSSSPSPSSYPPPPSPSDERDKRTPPPTSRNYSSPSPPSPCPSPSAAGRTARISSPAASSSRHK